MSSQKTGRSKKDPSYQFLDDCTYNVKLTDLYNLKSTCYYNQNMPYCPVLVRVEEKQLIEKMDNYPYLLQIWDSKENIKKKEIRLHSKITVWNIFYNYFIYKPADDKDENSGFFHIINLETNATVLVPDFTNKDRNYKHVAFMNNLFYLANSDQIKVLKVDDFEDGKVNEMKPPDESEIGVIIPEKHRIHGFYLDGVSEEEPEVASTRIIVALETPDYQIDLNQIVIKDERPSRSMDYELIQMRPLTAVCKEASSRPDPLTKFQLIINDSNCPIGVALRKSGQVDFYYDGMLCVSNDQVQGSQGIEREEGGGASYVAQDVDISFDDVFIMCSKLKAGGDKVTLAVSHQLGSRMAISDAREQPDDYKFDQIFFQRVKSHCKLYRGFVFLKTFIFVAHGNILSLYDMRSQTFTKHIEFDHDILQVFRSKRDGDFDVCVLMQSDQQRCIIEFVNRGNGKDSETYDVDEGMTQKIDGTVLQFDQDRDDNEWTFILVLHDKKIRLQCLHGTLVDDITDKFVDQKKNEIELSGDSNLTFFFSPKEQTEVLIHNEDYFYVYEINYDEEAQEIEINPQEYGLNLWIDKSLQEKEPKPIKFVEYELHSAIRVKGSLMILVDEVYFYVVDFSNPNFEQKRFEQRCAGLFLSDNNFIYTLTHKNQEKDILSGFRLYDIENCISKIYGKGDEADAKANKGPSSKKAQQSKKQGSQDFMSYHLQGVQVGCQGLIDFSHQNQRLVYQSSYNTIEVVPVLHRNTIAFVGMSEREDYLATKVIDDRFLALDKRNFLTSWDIVTGKLSQDSAPWNILADKQDYSNFEIYAYSGKNHAYHQDWAQRVLLRSKEPVKEKVDWTKYFDASMVKSNSKKQKSFIESLSKEFYEFKYIEIQSEKKVLEHFSFIYPSYFRPTALSRKMADQWWSDEEKDEDEKSESEDEEEGAKERKPEKPLQIMQYLYFNTEMDMMLEILSNARVFLYKKQHKRDHQHPNRVTWQLEHRFSQFPDDLITVTQYPFLFSPDFSQYIDVDRKQKLFIIKDSMTQNRVTDIPDHIINFKSEDLLSVAARFAWDGADSLKVISKDGIERKIAIKKDRENGCFNFEEEKLNVIPLFDQLVWAKANKLLDHLIIDKCRLPVTDTRNRLKLKYQAFKSAYYMQNKLEGSGLEKQIYPKIYTVDYTLDGYSGRYVADLSFTFLHWNLMEKLQNKQITINQIDQNSFQKLIYNILPRGETVLHSLKDDGGKVVEILSRCHPNPQRLEYPPIETHVPFIVNFQGDSPMDLLCAKSDFRTANQMLQFLSSYGIDHHSRALTRQVPLLIEKRVPFLRRYIDSRLLQTAECRAFTKGNLLEEREPPGVCVASYCLSQETEEIISTKADIQSDLELKYFDLPVMHQYDNELCQEFFSALAETEDMSLFDNKGIINLIEFRWPLAREYVIKRLFVPFVIFLFTFVLYMGQIYEWREKEGFFYEAANQSCMAVLLAQSLYFIGIELYQLGNNGLDYFRSFWNYLDLIPPILILVFIPLALNGTFDKVDEVKQNQTLESSLQATISLLMWLKLLYFLRIFEKTGYLIKIIVAVCVDMGPFLVILLLTIMAFGDSMRAISTSNLPQHEFIHSWWQSFTYVYRMILGNFNTEPTILEGGPLKQDGYSEPNSGFGLIAPFYTWFIFYMCTVLNMIIMLNLLVAIISESFARINQKKTQANQQEKCDIIAENTYLIPKWRKNQFCRPDRFLLIATDTQQELSNQPKDSGFLLRETSRKIQEATTATEIRLLEAVEVARQAAVKGAEIRFGRLAKDNQEVLTALEDRLKNL